MALTLVPVGQRSSQGGPEKKGQDEWQPLRGGVWQWQVPTRQRVPPRAGQLGTCSLVSWDLHRVGSFGEGAGTVVLKVETQ